MASSEMRVTMDVPQVSLDVLRKLCDFIEAYRRDIQGRRVVEPGSASANNARDAIALLDRVNTRMSAGQALDHRDSLAGDIREYMSQQAPMA